MSFWLMKSEPGTYSIDDLERDKVAGWDGVRNYQARNFMRSMAVGDEVLFYHSSAEPSAIVGLVKVARTAYPDPEQFDPKSDYFDPKSTRENPRWFQVDVRFVRRFPRPLPIAEVRRDAGLQDMVLLKRGRLSVQPVTKAEWGRILKAVG